MLRLGKKVGALMLAATLAAAPNLALADKSDDTVVIAFGREVTGLDYNQEVPTEYIMVGDLIDDSLFYVEPEGLTYAPSLATDATLVDDVTVDVNLRQDAKFHDGTLMTADDVVYTFNYIKDDTENARHAKIADWLTSIEKTGEFSVRFNLSYPYANFYNDLYRVKIRKTGIMGQPGAYDSKAQITTNNGLGPYKVKSFDPGVELVLERNEDYFDGPKGRPAIKNMVIRSIPDEGTQQAELLSGGIHWMYNVGRDVGEAVARSPQVQFVLGPSLRTGFLVLDAGGYSGEGNPLTKVEVRRAMNHAINRKQIAEVLVGGSAEPIDTACHPAVFGCTQDVMKYDYNPEKAIALLAEAGYPNGFDLELWAYRDKDISEAIASDLGKVGINVQLRYVKLASLNQARADRQIRAYFGTWGSTASPDTATIANIHWRSPEEGDRNLSGDPRTTELMLGAEQTLDPEKRKALYKQGLQLIAEQAYWVPLQTYSEGVLFSNEINFTADKDGYPRLWTITWK